MEKLIAIQAELKAPKNQHNDFGKYNYRSCEDILEAVKPILKKHNAYLTLSDEIVLIGTRYYVKATATLISQEPTCSMEKCVAYARESEDKKGMDAAQITGAASSYARKYALNGLFLIDDTKDSDATNSHGKEVEQEISGEIVNKINSFKDLDSLRQYCKDMQETFPKEVKKSFIAACTKRSGEIKNA